MLGLFCFIIQGLSIRCSFNLSRNIQVIYELKGAMLMKMIILGFMVGDSVCGMFFQHKEKV